MESYGVTFEPRRRLTDNPIVAGTIVLTFVLLLLVSVSVGPIHIGPIHNERNAHLQISHVLGLALYSCANDNDQMYPDTSSSTELFQKLLDGGYITDPTVFYIPMPGKVKPVAGQKLKPENVCWDVTEPTDYSQVKDIPLVFMTGYKINYSPGGSAVPRIMPTPLYGKEKPPPPLLGWLWGAPYFEYSASEGIAVFYDTNAAEFHVVAPDGSIPDVVPLKFKPDRQTYRQLTPDGVLK